MSGDREQLESSVADLVRSYGNDQVFGPNGEGLVADVLAAPGEQSDDVTALRSIHALLASGSSDLADWQRLRANPTIAHLPEEAVAWASATWRSVLGTDPAPQPEISQRVAPQPAIEVATDDHTVVHSPPSANTGDSATVVSPAPAPSAQPPVDLAPPTMDPEGSSNRLILGVAVGTVVLALGIGGGIWAMQRDPVPLAQPTVVPAATVVPTAVFEPTPVAASTPTVVATPAVEPTVAPTPTATPLPRPTPLSITQPAIDDVPPLVPAGDVVVPVLGSLGFTIPDAHPISQHGGHTLVYVDGSFNAEVDIFTPVVTRDGVPLDSVDQVVEFFGSDPNFVDMQSMGSTVINGFEAQIFDGKPRVALQRAFYTDRDTTEGELVGWFAPQQLRIWFIDTPRGVLAVSAESLSDDQVSFTEAVILATDVLTTLDLT